MIRHPRAIFIAATVAGLSFTMPAIAEVTAEEIGKRLSRLMDNQAVSLTWDSIDGSGNEYTIRGAKAQPKEDGDAAPLGDVSLRNVSELDGGDYVVGEMELPSLSIASSGVTVTLTGALMEGVLLAGPQSRDPMANRFLAERGRIDDVAVRRDETELFQMSNFHYVSQRSNDGWDMTYSGAADRFSSDLSKIDDPKVIAALTPLQLLRLAAKWKCAAACRSRAAGPISSSLT